MNLKLLVALLSAGILVMLGCTAVVAALPPGSTAANQRIGAATSSDAWMAIGSRFSRISIGNSPRKSLADLSHASGTAVSNDGTGRTGSASQTSPTTPVPPPTTSSTTSSSAPPSTAFVLMTVTYAVKQGDTITSIADWFDLKGYGAQFAANLQVIEDNRNLLVPGALISISNGIMTIHSPV